MEVTELRRRAVLKGTPTQEAAKPPQERSSPRKHPASSHEDPTKSTTVRIKPGPSTSPTNSRASTTASSGYRNYFLHQMRWILRVLISAAVFEFIAAIDIICLTYSAGLYLRYSTSDDSLPWLSHEPKLQLDAIDDIPRQLIEHTGYYTYYTDMIQRHRGYFAVPEDGRDKLLEDQTRLCDYLWNISADLRPYYSKAGALSETLLFHMNLTQTNIQNAVHCSAAKTQKSAYQLPRILAERIPGSRSAQCLYNC